MPRIHGGFVLLLIVICVSKPVVAQVHETNFTFTGSDNTWVSTHMYTQGLTYNLSISVVSDVDATVSYNISVNEVVAADINQQAIYESGVGFLLVGILVYGIVHEATIRSNYCSGNIKDETIGNSISLSSTLDQMVEMRFVVEILDPGTSCPTYHTPSGTERFFAKYGAILAISAGCVIISFFTTSWKVKRPYDEELDREIIDENNKNQYWRYH